MVQRSSRLTVEAGSSPGSGEPALSVVVPCYCEEGNLDDLVRRLQGTLDEAAISWELVLIDDHSPDKTFEAARRLSEEDARIRVIRLARNCGSHIAIRCGLSHATGGAAAVLAADLQDPPELLPALFEKWKGGAQIVWAVRARRLGISWWTRTTSRMFNSIMARVVENPVTGQGADFFLIDRIVVEALAGCTERHANLFTLLQWMGFRQESLLYDKESRHRGSTGWTLRRQIKLLIDSIVGFSYFPIRLISILGVCTGVLGFLYAGVVIGNYIFNGISVEGWSSLMIVVLVIGGTLMMMLGVLGEYLWRGLDETRSRPLYFVEEVFGTSSEAREDRRQRARLVRASSSQHVENVARGDAA